MAEPPEALKRVEDRDLWRFKYPDTREVQANIFSYPYEFSVWDYIMDDKNFPYLREGGDAIERKHFKDINELIPATLTKLNIGDWLVSCANLPYTLSSDAGRVLMEEYKQPFGVCFFFVPNGVRFSLRGVDSGPDVSEIAKLYKGGGHRNAAGFTIPYSQFFYILANAD